MTKITSPAMPEADDALTFCETDTVARKIFVAYTTRIPWLAEHPNWALLPKRKKPGGEPGFSKK